MRSRRLGGSGLEVSLVGLGCNAFGRRIDGAQAERVVHAALDRGITFFDTADIYGDGESERMLGAALRGRRDGALIATKFAGRMGDGPNRSGGSRQWVMRAVEDSLRRLDTDVIDLYQMHTPDPDTPIEETLRALDDCVHQGKVRYVGCSNFDGWQVADADWVARTQHLHRFVSAQNHYSLAHREVEREVLPACRRFGLGMLPYFPLAGGLLTGKYRRGQPPPPGTRFAGDGRFGAFLNDRGFDIAEALERIAAERGVTLLHIAMGWLAAQPDVASVIAGVTRPEQVEANVEAGLWEPDAETLAAIDAAAPLPSVSP